MLSIRVNSDTRMMNIGSEGGSVIEHLDVSFVQVHCDAPDSILDGTAVQDAYNGQEYTVEQVLFRMNCERTESWGEGSRKKMGG